LGIFAWSKQIMDGVVLGLYLAASFVGGVTTGLAGFAMGLVVSGVWLHILTPVQTASLITGYGLLVQGYGIWKLRHAFKWRNVMPFIAGGAIGVPIGTYLLTYVQPAYLRTAVGVLLMAYSIYGLARPVFKPIHAGRLADTGVGFLNGVLGGLTGLAGIIVVIWCQLQGWSKDVQRVVYQPVIGMAFLIAAVLLGASGAITGDTIKLYFLGLPMVLIGMWLGLKLYGHLDETTFRKIILVLLLLSGFFLVVPMSAFH
jgi:uncharacterized membrane protein YfcA